MIITVYVSVEDSKVYTSKDALQASMLKNGDVCDFAEWLENNVYPSELADVVVKISNNCIAESQYIIAEWQDGYQAYLRNRTDEALSACVNYFACEIEI